MKVMRTNTISEKAVQYRPPRSNYSVLSSSWHILRLLASALDSFPGSRSRNILFTALAYSLASRWACFDNQFRQNSISFFRSFRYCVPYHACLDKSLKLLDLLISIVYHIAQKKQGVFHG